MESVTSLAESMSPQECDLVVAGIAELLDNGESVTSAAFRSIAETARVNAY